MKNTRTMGRELIVVLGAGVTANGAPSERTAARTQTAVLLAKQLPEATIIVTGDGRPDKQAPRSKTEASCMARILRANGISGSRIRLEHQAVDTMGNTILVAARFLMNATPRKIHLVTSPFHAERASVMFRGIYGPCWPIEVHTSAVCDGDEAKGVNEHGGIEWALRFLEGTTPGDFMTAILRLREVGKPVYRQLRFRRVCYERARLQVS